jgi:hypothetical protein
LHSDLEDFVAWHVSRNGIFSVQIAYDSEWMYKFRNMVDNFKNIGASKLMKFGKSRESP